MCVCVFSVGFWAVNLDERLRLSSCLDDYKLQEVVVAASGSVLTVHDLPAMKKSQPAFGNPIALSFFYRFFLNFIL